MGRTFVIGIAVLGTACGSDSAFDEPHETGTGTTSGASSVSDASVGPGSSPTAESLTDATADESGDASSTGDTTGGGDPGDGPWDGPYHHHDEIDGVAVDLYLNIETAGLHVVGVGLDAALVEARVREVDGDWRTAAPFLLVADATGIHFASSMFDLRPNTAYEVEVTAGATEFSFAAKTQPDGFTFTPVRTLHVAVDAAPGGDGTAALPFDSIQAAIDTAQPGDRISVGPGTYRERLATVRSGEPNAWIQIVATDGLGSVIIDGSDPSYLLEDLDWQPWTGWTELGCTGVSIDEGVLWAADVRDAPFDFGYVVRDGEASFNYGTTSDLETSSRIDSLLHVAQGVRCRAERGYCSRVEEGHYFDEQTDLLILRSLTPPSEHQFLVSAGAHALVVDGHDWIWVEGLEFRHNFADNAGAVRMRGSVDHAVVRDNRFVHSGDAITLAAAGSGDDWSAGSDNRIEHNEITYPSVGSQTYEMTKNNPMRGDAIFVEGGMQNIVRSNWVHDAFRGIGFAPLTDVVPYRVGLNTEVDFYDNRLDTIASARLIMEGQWVNARVFRNVARTGHVGITMHINGFAGPFWYVRNVIHGFEDRMIKRQDVESAEREPAAAFYHNAFVQTDLRHEYTCEASPMSLCASASPYDWTPSWDVDADCRYLRFYWGAPASTSLNFPRFRFRNNIFYSTNYNTMLMPAPPLMDMDHDAFWHAGDNSPPFSGIAKIAGDAEYYADLETFTAEYGIEAHGVDEEPRFTDLEGMDYTLGADSPLIDAAEPLAGINDLACAAPDIGPIESDCAG